MKYQIVLFSALLMSVSSHAETESLKTFKAGDRVKAAEMNSNFSTLDSKIDTLKESVTFDGLDDVYSGTAETEAGGSEATSSFSVEVGVYGPELQGRSTSSTTAACNVFSSYAGAVQPSK